jgi:hypothetical protein
MGQIIRQGPVGDGKRRWHLNKAIGNGLNKLTFRDVIANEVKQSNEIAAWLRSSQ